MKDPGSLSKHALEEIIRSIQSILYGFADEKGWGYDPNKEWDADFIEMIDREIGERGLRPRKRFRQE